MPISRRRGNLGLASVTPLVVTLFAAIAVFGQNPIGTFEVSGVVLDPSGAVVTDAKVTIRLASPRAERVASTNSTGEFHFTGLTSGTYEIEVQKHGFRQSTTRVEVKTKSPAPVRIVLELSDVSEEISVRGGSDEISTRPEENLDVIKLDHDELKDLPVLGNDVIGSISTLLDSASLGSDDTAVIVDGLETARQKLPASTIQEVRINQNPYSAEYRRPGRGRIEVVTKPGSTGYHGEFNFVFRDHRLDARNAFALERPPEQRRNFEGVLSGPLVNGKNTSFLFAVDREEEDLQSVVFASTAAGIVSANVANPNRETEISFRIDHQAGANTNFSVRYESSFESSSNRGVGGYSLQEAATNSSSHEHRIFFTLRNIISPTLINELTMRIGNEVSSSRSVNLGTPRIVVLDAFTGGSGQIDRRATENRVRLNEIVSWTHGEQFVRFGLNIPEINRRGFADRTNFDGTFSFSTLADYADNRPFLFSINQGDSRLVIWQRDFGLFVQDSIRLRPNFSVGVGLRYDRQSHLGDNNNLAPRLSFAYSPGAGGKTVVRGGAGVFYDRTGIGAISARLRFDGERLRQLSISDPGYPDPFSAGGTQAAQPPDIVRFAPDIREPYRIQIGAGVERQLTKSLTASANYVYLRGVKMFRSRNINAPLPPLFLETPDPAIGVLRQVESSGQMKAHSLELMLRGELSRFFSGTVQYRLGRAYNNTNGINSLPADSYDLSGEWSRAGFDQRHRFNLFGTVEAGHWFKLGMRLSLASGRPYSLTTGRDDNRDTIANDRPSGVRRNTLQGPGLATLDLRWSKEFLIKETKTDEGPTVTVGVDAFNVLNRTNYASFVGNLSSPFFGLPVSSRPARRLQLTLGFAF